MLKDYNELSLIKLISQWPRVVELSAKHMEPHRICYYLIELASEFHSLWNKGKVDENLKPLIPSSLEPQNIQEKQQIMEDLKALGASKSKLQAEIAEKQAQIDQITKKEDLKSI